MGVKKARLRRRSAASVNIGQVPMGSDHPIRVQSMANTLTSDLDGSLAQCLRIAEAGADYVRFTVPAVSDIRNIAVIREKMREKGFQVPIIADVHFNSEIAFQVSQVVDKVRINPGNFSGLHKPGEMALSDESFKMEFQELRKKFIPLLEKCRTHHTALRIGVNHGSLSQRIMDRYGDTPAGMAESAMEFLRICKARGFDQVVVSMKSSNVMVMVQATRLVVKRMDEEDMHFPLHLGVTEAGEGEDGRIKSAVGIGALLNDGLGDTIRVSLTEEPEMEVPVALKLIRHISLQNERNSRHAWEGSQFQPLEFNRRNTAIAGNIGGGFVPVVIGESGNADYLFREIPPGSGEKTEVSRIIPYAQWLEDKPPLGFPLMSAAQYAASHPRSDRINFVWLKSDDVAGLELESFASDRTAIIVYHCYGNLVQDELRWFYSRYKKAGCNRPVIVRVDYREDNLESLQVKSAADLGGTFIDGMGNGLWITNRGSIAPERVVSLSFGILQTCRARITRTEYISCPSCGRTNFNLMETLERIKAATSHLTHLKIGVMGCIVNGPGEMADADYGYVGAGQGKVTLYKSKQVVKRGIPENSAVAELIAVIKENGDWKES
jgi:(E)-4-hydroxy-3-methylbut-2-enyl-diphosphate synthase